MRCEEFSARLNQLLDDRCEPTSDVTLLSHASECRDCQNELECWHVIDHRLTGPFGHLKPAIESCVNQATSEDCPTDFVQVPNHHRGQRLLAWLTLATAASWMVFTLDNSSSGPDLRLPAAAGPAPFETAEMASLQLQSIDLRNLDLRIDEPKWWGEMASATLRPVEPLTNGFRPLANSLQSALQILTPKHASTPAEAIVPDGDFSAQRPLIPYEVV